MAQILDLNLDALSSRNSEWWFIPKAWVLLLLLAELLISLYIFYRQYIHITSVLGVPPLLEQYAHGIYTSVDLDFSREFELDKLYQDVGKKVYTIFTWMIIIYISGIYRIWKIATLPSPVWPNFIDPVISRNMSFSVLFYIAYETILLPISISKTNFREKHGNYRDSRKKTSSFYILYFKEVLLNIIPVALTAGILSSFILALDKKQIHIQVIIFLTFFYVFIILYPSFEVWCQMAEYKNSRRLSSPNLYRLCEILRFPKKYLITLQRSSARISHDTAFYYGFLWFRRIVVFHDPRIYNESTIITSPHTQDTFLTRGEIEGIVCHEIGHWEYLHSTKDLLLWHAQCISAIIFTFVLRYSWLELFHGFGFPANPSDVKDGIMILPGAIVAYYLILRIYTAGFEFLYQLHQHGCENEADDFAANLSYGKSLGRALIKIAISSKAFPSQDPLYSLFHHSHPSLVTRLQRFSDFNKNTERKSGYSNAARRLRPI